MNTGRNEAENIGGGGGREGILFKATLLGQDSPPLDAH